MHQVLFYSRGGNTRKLADAIAEALGTRATDVAAATVDPAGIVFLGSGVYGGKPGDGWMKFVEAHDFAGRHVALFSTSFSDSDRAIDAMAEALKKKGATIIGNYHCKGRFLLLNRGKPDVADLAAARQFALDMVKNG
jgi:flavodoxin